MSYNIDLRSAYHFHVRLHRIFRQIHHLHVGIIPNDCLFWQFLSENDFILNISNSHSRLNGSSQSTFHNLRSISQFSWNTLLVPKTPLALWEKSYILVLISCDCACISTISISKGRHQKKKLFFFFRKTLKGVGGVSPNPKFPYQKKLRFFVVFFKRGGPTYSKRVLS